jgi:hypothetical protein
MSDGQQFLLLPGKVVPGQPDAALNMNGTQGRSGHALMRFMERRSSVAVKIPPQPQGTGKYAPLELLSGVALDQMRQASTFKAQELTRYVILPPIRSNLKCSIKNPLSLSSPLSVQLPSESSNVAKLEEIKLLPSNVSCSSDGCNDADLKEIDSSDVSVDIQSKPSKVGIKILAGNQNFKESATLNMKGRCQASRFCHICEYMMMTDLIFDSIANVCM